MKYRNLLLSTVTVGLTGSFFLFMPSFKTEDSGYSPRRAANEAKSADQAFEHYKSKRLNDNGVYDPELIRTTRNALMTDLQRGVYGSRAVSLSFYEEGPDNIGGRTRAILIEKNNPQLIFAGSVTGGLWASSNGGNTWGRVASFSENLAVSAMAQTGNGRIYVGTGMAFFNEGWVGNGIYYSDDLGTTWTNLNGTTTYAGITEITADPSNGNKIYFGTNNGLKTFDSAVDTAPVSVTTLGTTTCFDIKISPDGQTIVAGVSFSGVRTWVSNDGGVTWTNVSGTAAGLIPSSGRGRIEYAISDTKNAAGYWNIYASAVTSGGGVLAGMYVSEDSGNTWTEIAPASTTGFDPFRTGLNTGQGVYDNVITVLPGEPEKILVGGIDVYAWVKAPGVSPTYGQWEQRSLWFAQPTSSATGRRVYG